MLKKARRNWRWRPASTVAADPRHWWRFTIHSVLDVVHRTRYGSAQRTVPELPSVFNLVRMTKDKKDLAVINGLML
jgi:hypothetical protein